jgi:hypothetical protein
MVDRTVKADGPALLFENPKSKHLLSPKWMAANALSADYSRAADRRSRRRPDERTRPCALHPSLRLATSVCLLGCDLLLVSAKGRVVRES